ncbi:hypothetical protein L798_01762 [Zootermopsis nevadensis]|uniref:Uncharacterized protein n=1 Tax=Zootermopsis nevadensis TaxID=136037 RepID=A0A067QKT0_ZOONE|nr:hypothetical protein L798_01762 [Zootermopsis nevadensis]
MYKTDEIDAKRLHNAEYRKKKLLQVNGSISLASTSVPTRIAQPRYHYHVVVVVEASFAEIKKWIFLEHPSKSCKIPCLHEISGEETTVFWGIAMSP